MTNYAVLRYFDVVDLSESTMNIARTIADRIFRPIVQYSPIEKPRYVVFTSTDVRKRNDNEEEKIKANKLLDYVLKNHDMLQTPIVTLPAKDAPDYLRRHCQLPNLSSLLIQRARKINFPELSLTNQRHMRTMNILPEINQTHTWLIDGPRTFTT